MSYVDLHVQSAVNSLKADNPDIPGDFWDDIAAELSDSRYYYKAAYCDPNYEEAFKYGQACVKSYRDKQVKSVNEERDNLIDRVDHSMKTALGR